MELKNIYEPEKIAKPTKTRLEKIYGVRHLADIFVGLAIFLTVANFLLAIMPLTAALFIAIYFMFIFMITVVVVVATVGLIFTIKDNFISKMWASIGHVDMNVFMNVQQIVFPITLSLQAALFALALIFTIIDRKKEGIGSRVAAIVICGVFLAISLMIYLVSRSGVK